MNNLYYMRPTRQKTIKSILPFFDASEICKPQTCPDLSEESTSFDRYGDLKDKFGYYITRIMFRQQD